MEVYGAYRDDVARIRGAIRDNQVRPGSAWVSAGVCGVGGGRGSADGRGV